MKEDGFVTNVFRYYTKKNSPRRPRYYIVPFDLNLECTINPCFGSTFVPKFSFSRALDFNHHTSFIGNDRAKLISKFLKQWNRAQ